MKTGTIVHLAFSTAMLFYASYCKGQSNVVYYGTNSNALDVVFADTNLSAKVKSAITVDLNLCLQEWGKTAELFLWEDEDTIDEGIVGQLSIGTVCPHYPEDVKFPENIVSNGTHGVALQITKELSDAYLKAFAFTNANAKAVKAAYKFVSLIRSDNFIASLTPANISGYVFVKQYKAKDYVEEFEDIVGACFEDPKYLLPSVLGFREQKTGFLRKNIFLALPAYTIPDDNGFVEWESLPAIWKDGKWKLYWDLDDWR